MVDKPDHSLWRQSRLLGVYLKGQAYNAAVVITEDPLRVWRAKIDEVTPLLDPIGSPAIAGFFSAVQAWPQRRTEVEYHRMLLRQGLQAMNDLKAWWTAAKTR